jgi:hypothetical protein
MEYLRWIGPDQGRIIMGLDREVHWAERPCDTRDTLD